MKLFSYLLLLLTLFTFQQNLQSQNWWTDAEPGVIEDLEGTRWIEPRIYRTIDVDLDALNTILDDAPLWFTPEAENSEIALTFPMPDGSTRTFLIQEAPVMEPGLAAQYPNMRSFAGKSTEDGTAYARFGVTHKGFHAMILSGKHSTVFIDVMTTGQHEIHQVYYKKDYNGIPGNEWSCGVTDSHDHGGLDEDHDVAESIFLGDCTLREYRLALACTGEFSQFHGGTIPDVMAELNIILTRVNSVYERDFTIHMNLIDNNDEIIYLNGATDPYDNGGFGVGQMLDQNQTNLDNVIGFNNYDIGHVLAFGGNNGVAGLNAVCGNNKAWGVTRYNPPVGDPFVIDYVSHEMGHQFGANHTQNNSCNRVNATAMEPGSASTIMGYAGICAPNVQNNSDDHFHAISIQEITNFIENGAGDNCPQTTVTGNSGPTVTTAGNNYILPISTPFFLTAIADDVDGDSLTYCWEQMDNEIATMPPQSTNSGGPAFRSNSPTPSPTRYFPNISAIVNGTTPTWEVIPSVSRDMDFRCSVRDNAMGGGCVNAVDVSMEFTNQAGPFLVLSPNTPVTWMAFTTETVTWDVANTNNAPVSCANVDIYLSLDGGFTYTELLAENIPNDGSHDVVVPNIATDQARVQIVCSDNIFFDISDEDFTIEEVQDPTFVLIPSVDVLSQCNDQDAVFELSTLSLAGFDEEITFSVTGVPAGATFDFDQNPVVPGETVVLTIGDLQNAMAGIYTMEVLASTASIDLTANLTLNLATGVPAQATLELPADGSVAIATDSMLTWAADFAASEYFIEIATTPAFGADVVESATVSASNYTPVMLAPLTVYYWRVTPSNECGDGDISDWFSFQTLGGDCQIWEDTDPGLVIPDDGVGSFSTTLEVDEAFSIVDVNVNFELSHTYVGDVSARLESPEGTEIILFERPGFPASQFGCNENNILAFFDDDAPNTSDDFENTCEGGTPYAIEGDFQPINPLAGFSDESSEGTWILTLSDAFDQDGGTLEYWSLEICRAANPNALVQINNNTLQVPQGGANTIFPSLLTYERIDVAAEDITYTILEAVEFGELMLMPGMNVLGLGAQFTQADLDNGLIVYQHDGSMTTADNFRFDVTDPIGGWQSNQVFNIEILDPSVIIGFASILSQISCEGNADGIIEANISGGVPPYQYSINGVDFQNESVFENLAPGDYFITVLDDIGNQFTTPQISLIDPPAITANTNVMGTTVTIDAMGGTGMLEYSLDDVDYQTSNTFSGLDNGDYVFFIRDENGCVLTVNATINVIIQANITSNPTSCNGLDDGSISIDNVLGGVEPYMYSIDNGPLQSTPIFENLGANTYSIQVQDANGFVFNIPFVDVVEPDALTFNTGVVGNILEIEALGGTSPYMYSIDGGMTFTDQFEYMDLENGDYEIIVMDANGCLSGSETIIIDVVNTTTIPNNWSINLFPNPSKGTFTINGSGVSGNALEWRLVDVLGRTLSSGVINIAGGTWMQSFEFTDLSEATYWLELRGDADRAILPIVIIK